MTFKRSGAENMQADDSVFFLPPRGLARLFLLSVAGRSPKEGVQDLVLVKVCGF